MSGKPNMECDFETAAVCEPAGTGEAKLSAAGSIDRTFAKRSFKAEKVYHRMCAEFTDFAKIIDENDTAAAEELLRESLIAMKVLETARKSAGIRFGCDG